MTTEATTVPRAIVAQLDVLLREPQGDNPTAPIALIWPEPLASPEAQLTVADHALRIVHCRSDLALREQLVASPANDSRLVLLTGLDEARIAQDVRARLWRCRAFRVSPWRTLQQLLQVVTIDPRLTTREYRWLAEVLVDNWPAYRDQLPGLNVLDMNTAWQAMALALLNYHEPAVDLPGLFRWSLQSGCAARVKDLSPPVREHLGDWLNPHLGRVADVVNILVLQDHVDQLLAIGLVCAVLSADHQTPANTVFQARGGLLQTAFGGRGVEQRLLRDFGLAAENFARTALAGGEGNMIKGALAQAEAWLSRLDVAPLAGSSDLLPQGFERRLDALAEAVQTVLTGGDSAPTWATADHLAAHQKGGERQDQVTRARMAARLCAWLRWRNDAADGPEREPVADYIAHGGFIDWARSRIWAGDEHEAASRAYAALAEAVGEQREADNKAFARLVPDIASGRDLPQGALPVEHALDQVVGPLASSHPVLLLVMDGMSQAVFRELAADMHKRAWVPLQPEQSLTTQHCLVAALPSITRVSRYSLLAGQIGEGLAAEEKTAFASHSALRAAADGTRPPRVLHKQELEEPRQGGLAAAARDMLMDKRHKVLAAVINVVDDQLGSNGQMDSGWTLESSALLNQTLEAAMAGDRLVVMTSDHGHVLEHGMVHRATDSSAERWRTAPPAPMDDEVLATGARVVAPGGSAVFPWSERVRYAARRRGYHGGVAPQEVLIPLGVFHGSADDKAVAGWREVGLQEPVWWNPVEPQTQPAPVGPVDHHHGDLFAAPDASLQGQLSWIEALLASPLYLNMKQRHARAGIKDEHVRALLELLAEQGGQAVHEAVARHLGLPPLRLNGFLANVRRLLNVDGYPVLHDDRASKKLELNTDALKRQFDL